LKGFDRQGARKRDDENARTADNKGYNGKEDLREYRKVSYTIINQYASKKERMKRITESVLSIIIRFVVLSCCRDYRFRV